VMMIRVAVKLSRAATYAARSASLGQTLSRPCGPSLLSPPPFRSLHDANPVAIQMVNYALSHARSRKSGSSPDHFIYGNCKTINFLLNFFNYDMVLYLCNYSDESYAQGLLVLEQCLSTQPSEGQDAENSRGLVLLAMSTLFSERFSFFLSLFTSWVLDW
jgi:hypothetical protein